jgi:hypothetical protein
MISRTALFTSSNNGQHAHKCVQDVEETPDFVLFRAHEARVYTDRAVEAMET